MKIYEVTNNTLPTEGVYLLDFYATWCQPCKMLMEVIKDMDSDVPVYKVNIEENMDLAKKFNVRGVPTLAIMKGEDTASVKSGFMKESELFAFIESNR